MRHRRGYPQREIDRAATRIRRHLTAQCEDGRLPRSLTGWRRLAAGCGLPVRPSRNMSPRFTARLLFREEIGWFAIYNDRHSLARRMQYVAHELAEYLAITAEGFSSLFDGIEGAGGQAFDGDGDPGDVRHRIACRFVGVAFRGRRPLRG